jgi:hypothetical protein
MKAHTLVLLEEERNILILRVGSGGHDAQVIVLDEKNLYFG